MTGLESARDEQSPDRDDHAQEVGPRLRRLRRRQRTTLKEIATRAGITESFLSQLERGLAGVSLPTLQRIAEALGTTVGELFGPDHSGRPHVVRREQRSIMEMKGWRNHLLTPRLLHNLEVFWIELDPGQSTADVPYTHGNSDEVLILLKGEVELRIDGQPHRLEPGDSIAYSSAVPHVVCNPGETVAEAIIALSPPSV